MSAWDNPPAASHIKPKREASLAAPAGSAEDPRMMFLRSIPMQVCVNWISDASRDELGICPSTFALGMDSRFRKTTPLEMFDLCAARIREHVASRHNDQAH